MARAALNWTLFDLVTKAGVSRNTLIKFEGGGKVRERTALCIQRAYEAAGVTFTEPTECGVRMRA